MPQQLFSPSFVTVVTGELSLIDTDDKLVETAEWCVPMMLLAGFDEDMLVTVFIVVVLMCPEMKQCFTLLCYPRFWNKKNTLIIYNYKSDLIWPTSQLIILQALCAKWRIDMRHS